MLGHDLRGPLNAILLTAEVLQTRRDLDDVAQDAEAVLRNGRRLKTLLDSLLEYSKARLGVGMPIHREHVDVAVLCREEVELLRHALTHVDVALQCEGDTNGQFDGSRVREALANLVFNAAQYSPPGTPVGIAVRGDEHSVDISTENDSDPIPDEVLQTLFEPLRRQAHVARGPSRNLGLGLFIVREIARAHGGDATACMVGPRVKFTITLPRTAALDRHATVASSCRRAYG